MDLYAIAVPTYAQMLKGLSNQLTKAQAFAADTGLSPEDLLTARLAPDMFPLSTQVRFVCTQASDMLKQLTGSEPFAPAEDATDFDGLRAQLAEAAAKVQATPASAFDGAAEKKVELKMPNGIVFDMTGEQFLRDWALAQFYFHAVTAYDILRHNGVDLSKRDYVSHAIAYLKPGAAPQA